MKNANTCRIQLEKEKFKIRGNPLEYPQNSFTYPLFLDMQLEQRRRGINFHGYRDV